MKYLFTFILCGSTLLNCYSQVDLSFGFARKKGDTIEVDIFMDTQETVKIFNFELRGIGGEVQLVGLVDGTAAQSLFTTNFDDASHKISAFSLAGTSIPKGSSVVMSVQFLNPNGLTDICIQNPVATGFTVTTGSCLNISAVPQLINDSKIKETDITVYPNPMSTEATISIINNQEDRAFNYEIILWDAYGKKIKEISTSSPKTIIEKGSLTSGIYFLSIKGNNSIITKKLIIQ